MAEEPKKEEGKTSIFWKLVPSRTRNRVFNWLNNTFGTFLKEKKPEGQPITLLEVYEQLQHDTRQERGLNFQDISDLNEFMVEVERMWDGGTPAADAESAAAIRNDVREFYRELGHFCDTEALEKEHELVGKGIPISQYETKDITINVPVVGSTLLKFKVPKPRDITFNHGLSYKVAYFGTEKSIAPELVKDFDAYFDSVLRTILGSGTSPEEKAKMAYVVKKYRRATQKALVRTEEYLKEFESKHRSFMSSLSTIKGAYATLLTRALKRRLEPRWVQYRHTFRVIKTNAKEKLIAIRFPKRPEEIDYGLDENGYSLEVAEKDYVYVRQNPDGSIVEEKITEGTVLLDVFNGNTRRVVPNTDEYTEYCDLLDMSAWIYVQYDAFRDDLRDGRYHDNSLSIMEYLLPRIPVEYLQFNHENLGQAISNNTKHTTTTMDLNNPPGRPKSVEWTVGPTHLNPAFDLRRDFKYRSKRDIHVGRKYYYDLQENSKQSKNPSMTTRGAAMWILSRVIERAKYWNETTQLLEQIGAQISGYDIGPNLQVKVGTNKEGEPEGVPERWGKTLTKNPFKPITGAGWK